MNNDPKVDNDLQKAIDDITNITNNDPVFAETPTPTPAPVPSPEDLYPTPAPVSPSRVQLAPVKPGASIKPATEPIAPATPSPAPVDTLSLEEVLANAPIAPAAPAAPIPAPAPEAPTLAPAPTMPELTTPTPALTPETPVPAATGPVEPFVDTPEDDLSTPEVKEAALRELAPILGKLDIPAERKFDIYKNVIDNYHDTSVFSSAYHAASGIEDEKARAEALLYLVEKIDEI